MELLARSDPEVVMPLDSAPPLSQGVILTLVRRLSIAIGEAPSVDDENFRTTLWWLERAAFVLNPFDPTISKSVSRILPSTQKILNSTRERLRALPDGQWSGAVRTLVEVDRILSGAIPPPLLHSLIMMLCILFTLFF